MLRRVSVNRRTRQSLLFVVSAMLLVTGPVMLGARQADPVAEFRRGALSPETARLEKPKATRSSVPQYTPEAMRARIMGAVELEVIVTPEGRVARARVVKGLDPGLDQNALTAVRSWEFSPGRLDGKTVTVWCEVTMTYRLH